MTILNASVSGMLADSNWLSSISQNVSNANTTGYKNAETDFSTMVDQVSNGASDGAGVMTSTISLNALQGNVVSSQTTTNLAVHRRFRRKRRALSHSQRLVRPGRLRQPGQ